MFGFAQHKTGHAYVFGFAQHKTGRAYVFGFAQHKTGRAYVFGFAQHKTGHAYVFGFAQHKTGRAYVFGFAQHKTGRAYVFGFAKTAGTKLTRFRRRWIHDPRQVSHLPPVVLALKLQMKRLRWEWNGAENQCICVLKGGTSCVDVTGCAAVGKDEGEAFQVVSFLPCQDDVCPCIWHTGKSRQGDIDTNSEIHSVCVGMLACVRV